jgi:hypothetical protein
MIRRLVHAIAGNGGHAWNLLLSRLRLTLAQWRRSSDGAPWHGRGPVKLRPAPEEKRHGAGSFRDLQ